MAARAERRSRSAAANSAERMRIGTHRNGSIDDPVEDPNVVQTQDVIGVGVREQHRVDRGDGMVDQLQAHVRRGIDQEAPTVIALHDDAGSGPSIPPLRRVAGAPVATSIGAADHEARRRSRRSPARSPSCGSRLWIEAAEIGRRQPPPAAPATVPAPRRASPPYARPNRARCACRDSGAGAR